MFTRTIMTVFTAILLAACSYSPMEQAYSTTVKLGCTVGNGDAFVDIKNNKTDDNYSPKEELKIFTFEGYTVPEDARDGFKQLFKLSARGCYLSEVQQNEEKKKKK